MPIKFNRMSQKCRWQEKNLHHSVGFVPSPSRVEAFLPGTGKQGNLALASSLHPQNGLNSKERFLIHLTELVQSEANTLLKT